MSRRTFSTEKSTEEETNRSSVGSYGSRRETIRTVSGLPEDSRYIVISVMEEAKFEFDSATDTELRAARR